MSRRRRRALFLIYIEKSESRNKQINKEQRRAWKGSCWINERMHSRRIICALIQLNINYTLKIQTGLANTLRLA